MNMLSSQIDELRQMADGGATYRDAREAMLRAADTIWGLRDDLQRVNAENAKLKQELESVGTAAYLYGRTDLEAENAKLQDENARLRSCLSDDADNARMIMGENAKLRELVRVMWLYDYAGKFSSKREDMEHVAMVYQRIRELGIEVD